MNIASASRLLAPFLLLLSLAAEADPRLVPLARQQIGVTVDYDPSYVTLSYPGGDVPMETGVCSDVVVRALRGLGLDLQQALHEDMKRNFSRYPQRWGGKRPDKNIDHRRVPNLECYFRRQGWQLPVTENPDDYQAGDIVTCLLGGSIPHIMIVSDRKDSDGIPMVIHNIGAGTQEENGLFLFVLTGHYRPKFGK